MQPGDVVRYIGKDPTLHGQLATVDEVWPSGVVVRFDGLGGLLYTAHPSNLEVIETVEVSK